MKKQKIFLVTIAVFLLCCFIISRTEGQSFVLSKVVDNNTPVPGGSGNFTMFSGAVISGSNVAFAETDTGVPHGIYLFNGSTINKVADTNTLVPEGTERFVYFGYPVISGKNVAFTDGENTGIYLFNGIRLTKVVDLNSSIPGGSGNFIRFLSPVISGENVAFWGFGLPSPGQDGIYLFNGTSLIKWQIIILLFRKDQGTSPHLTNR